jgi:hypothetical protein
MTLQRDELLDLMALADGEADEATVARARALLTRQPDAAAVLDAFGSLGKLVRDAEAERAPPAADAIADAVLASIQKGPIPIESARLRRLRSVGASTVVLASAAAAVFFAVRASGPTDERASAPAGGAVSVPTGALASAGENAEPNAAASSATAELAPAAMGVGVDVDNVDAPDNAVSLFFVPSMLGAQVNAQSVVVWISDEPARDH